MKSQMIVPKPVNTVAALYRQQHVDRGYPMPSDSVPRSKSPNQDTVVVTSGMLPVAHFMPFDLLFVCLYVFEKLKAAHNHPSWHPRTSNLLHTCKTCFCNPI